MAEFDPGKKSSNTSCIRQFEDGSLGRVNIDVENAKDDTGIAEVFCQYIYLADVIKRSINEIQAIGRRRFGKEKFHQLCESTYAQLGTRGDIVRAIQLIPWSDPRQPE